MDAYEESRNILHVGPDASQTDVDAAYHKWYGFWSTCESSCIHPDQRALASRELQRLNRAHRILQGRRAVTTAEAEWFPGPVTEVVAVPIFVEGTEVRRPFHLVAQTNDFQPSHMRMAAQDWQPTAIRMPLDLSGKPFAIPPPLPVKRPATPVQAPPPLPNKPMLRAVPSPSRSDALDWSPQFVAPPVPHAPAPTFIDMSKRRMRPLVAAVAVGLCMGVAAASLIDALPR